MASAEQQATAANAAAMDEVNARNAAAAAMSGSAVSPASAAGAQYYYAQPTPFNYNYPGANMQAFPQMMYTGGGGMMDPSSAAAFGGMYGMDPASAAAYQSAAYAAGQTQMQQQYAAMPQYATGAGAPAAYMMPPAPPLGAGSFYMPGAGYLDYYGMVNPAATLAPIPQAAATGASKKRGKKEKGILGCC